MEKTTDLKPAASCFRVVPLRPGLDIQAEASARTDRSAHAEKVRLDVKALLEDIIASYGERRTKDISDRDEISRVWGDSCIADGWTGETLRLGWDRYRQDAERSIYVPGYVDLVQAAYPTVDEARALCEKFIRLKSTGDLSMLTRQEYFAYQQCSTQLNSASTALYHRIRRWLLEAWTLGDQRLEAPPSPRPKAPELPSQVEMPVETRVAQLACLRSQPQAALAWAPNRIYLNLVRDLLDGETTNISPLQQQVVIDYLSQTGQITNTWDQPA